MASLPIIKAKMPDLDGIRELLIKCMKALEEKGFNYWDDEYPVNTDLTAGLENGSIFIIKVEEQIIATITVDNQQPEAYQKIEWSIDAEKVLVLHRLAIHPDFQGRGISKYLCRFAENYAKSHNYQAIRLDCFEGNPVANQLYETLEYEQAKGVCHFRGKPEAFVCYEKEITI